MFAFEALFAEKVVTMLQKRNQIIERGVLCGFTLRLVAATDFLGASARRALALAVDLGTEAQPLSKARLSRVSRPAV